jgi:DNA-binding transcriptional LysR family regulator
MTLSLRQLEYFVAVVDEGSFTVAASRLHVSQPGLSHQVLSLERQLGGPLLERLGRGVRLTPAGRIALPHARASLAHAERARAAALRASGVDAGELHVGTLFSISVGVLPGALQVWRSRYPDIQIRLVEFRRSADLIAAMEAGQADVAVGPTPPGWTGPTREIGAERFVITAAARTALPSTPPIVRMRDLADHVWVHYTQPSGLADILDAACAQAGFQPRVAVRTEQSASALNLCEAGLGITLLPGNVIPAHFDGIVLQPDPPVERMLSVYTRVRPDPITEAFVDAIVDQALATPAHIVARLRPAAIASGRHRRTEQRGIT